jgi:hypothetical protein
LAGSLVLCIIEMLVGLEPHFPFAEKEIPE